MATNKFKFRFKITGLELEVEGTKEDVAAITSNLSNQIKGLVQPQGVIDGQGAETEEADATEIKDEPTIQLPPQKKRGPKKTRSTAGTTPKASNAALDFRNDSTKYGTPTQQWSSLQKALWTLYVINLELGISELSASQVTETYNKHFKQTKIIRASNVSRDFGKNKMGSKHLVGENTTLSPTTWYLSEEGQKVVQKLIADQKSSINGVN